MKLNILVVNRHESERIEWSRMLKATGHNVVGETGDLSGMIQELSRRSVHIAVCSSELIKQNAHKVLQSAMRFFPRIKIVIVGRFTLPQDLPKLTYVVIKRKFDCDFNGLFDFPEDAWRNDSLDDKQRLLFSENFLESKQADSILNLISPRWIPDYAILCVLAGSNTASVMHILNGLARKLSLSAVIQMNLSEICVVLSNSPSTQRCIETADAIRENLLFHSNAGFNIGISRSRGRACELSVCRKEALQAASASDLYGWESVIHINYLDNGDIWYAYPRHKERRQVDCTLEGNVEQALALLDELFDFLKSRVDLHKKYINKIAMRIWVELNLAVVSRNPAFEAAQTDAMAFGKLFSAKNPEEIYEFLKSGIEGFASEMREISNIRRDVLFVELDGIKDERREPEVSELTNRFHTTVSFLNDAIVRNSDKNIFDFFD